MKKHLVLLLFVHLIASRYVQAQPTQQSATDNWYERTSQPLNSPFFMSDRPDDAFWDDRFYTGGPSGFITSMIFDAEDNLYVGGLFSTSGREVADLVARWDGTSWSGVGGGNDIQLRREWYKSIG